MKGQIRFVLVGPQSAGNVGSAARALKNFGFSDLRVVAPSCDPYSSQGLKMAVSASDLLRSAPTCDTLDEALQGAVTVIGASRRTGKHRWPHYQVDRIVGEIGADAMNSEIALVFGREDHGLCDQELDRCTHLVHIPTSREYPSLNLAQSVVLMAWEFHRSTLPPPVPEHGELMAEHGAKEAMYAHLENALATIGFLKEDSAEVLMRRIRRMLGRAGLSENEVRVVRGIAHQTLWAAGKAGLVQADPHRNESRDGSEET